ncbi:MAG: CHAT domain-containing protein [Cyanobacteria bacterium J06581_3]
MTKKILFVSSNPNDSKPLRLDEERREILQELKLAGKLSMESVDAARTSDLQRALLRVEPQVVHFSGHGVGDSGLVFEDLVGRSQLVNARALASLFELFSGDGLDCVILNACYSDVQAEVIAKHIRFVVGMNDDIGDAAAIKFSIGFYQALGAGRSVEFAYKSGCVAIQMEGIPEFLTPVLYKDSERIYGPEPIDLAQDEPATICPEGLGHLTSEVLKLCEERYSSEEIRLIEWNSPGNEGNLLALFRERRRGYYLQMAITKDKSGDWEYAHRIAPIFLPVLQQNEFEWHELTQFAPPEDWFAIDEIIRLGIKFPGSKILIANQFMIGEQVWEDAIKEFGMYVPDENFLPAFLFTNKAKGLSLISHFKHPDGFAKDNMVSDDSKNESRLFSSLKDAQESLLQKLIQSE